MDNTDVYCTAPWKGITVMADGIVKTCCIGKVKLGNLNDDSIDNIMASPVLEQIKYDLANGIKNHNCKVCHQQEESINYANLRSHFLKYYPLSSLQQSQINVVDVRWNNKCNLACQYCGPESSSTWQDKLGLPTYTVNKPYQDDLLDWIVNKSSQLREIMLAGGETMLMKQNYKLFSVAPADCRFSIVTNLSYDLEDLPCIPDLLKRPRDNVIWSISADNTYKQFEYVRTGASWEKFVKNINFLTTHWPNTIGLNIVYSILSAVDIDKTYQTFSELGVHKVSILQIMGNEELSVDRMPASIRTLCYQSLERLRKFHSEKFGIDQELYPISGIEMVYQSLTKPSAHPTISKEKFNQKINNFDSWSTVGLFQNLWPRLSILLDQELK
jgi:MoaA/NifB/PqqE/SkfB family radical SAM enzyme